jgi:DNA-binding PadR family transcriptional regulator
MADQLGRLEQLLLFALLRLEDGAYGAMIRQEIEERAGRSLTAAAIHTTLRRLESRGFVRSHVGEPTPERGGRRKKYYRLEPEGLTALETSWREVREMGAGLSAKLNRKLEEVGR